jgi:ribosomal protein L11 methyltransferase
MILLQATIDESRADALEAFCCEAPSPWWLVRPDPADDLRLHGAFPDRESARAAWEELRSTFPELPAEPDALAEQPDEDWMLAYRHHLRPWQSGPLRWIPEWERAEHFIQPYQRAVYLDSGLAFGTGSHETTRLCARSLVRFARERGDRPFSVIDAGCGSGILALSAAVLGARPVRAFDSDPEAIRVSRENAAANGREGTIEWFEAGMEEGLAGPPADLVLANIQADVLRLYADELLGAVAPGGRLVLSGILAAEGPALRDFFAERAAPAGFAPAAPRLLADGAWVALALDRA